MPARSDGARRALALLTLSAVCCLPARAAEEPANDPRVRAVAEQLVCYCGCSTQSVAYCSCGIAQQERAKILGELNAGKSGEAIVASWVDRYGTRILIEPPARGFNLLGWLLPSVVLMIVGLLLAFQIHRWSRTRPATATPATPGPELDPRYADRLDEELRRRGL